MKKQIVIPLLILFVSLSACQSLGASRQGVVMAACSQIVSKVSALKSGTIPEHLLTTGKKRGDEFDVNQYFDILTHISMRDGYTLDYVYQNDSLGGFPLLYPRPVDQAPYVSPSEISEHTELPNFREYLDVEDTEQGYFDYVVMDIMADQFYLFWHANYNDRQIVCNRQQMYDIVEQLSSGDFGNPMDRTQQAKARTLRNIVPVVHLTADTAVVEIVTFTKWGGFYRLTYTISRETPPKIIDIKQEELLPYDIGIVF